jgi:hypothetical protein
MKNSLFRQIDVWKKIDNSCVIRFRCFENLSTKLFCVQGSDYFHIPIDDKQLSDSDKQFLELLIEETPDTRSNSFSTVEEAVSAHLKEFE